MDRSYIWVVNSPRYLSEEKIKVLQTIVNNPNKRIDPTEFTHQHVPVG